MRNSIPPSFFAIPPESPQVEMQRIKDKEYQKVLDAYTSLRTLNLDSEIICEPYGYGRYDWVLKKRTNLDEMTTVSKVAVGEGSFSDDMSSVAFEMLLWSEVVSQGASCWDPLENGDQGTLFTAFTYNSSQKYVYHDTVLGVKTPTLLNSFQVTLDDYSTVEPLLTGYGVTDVYNQPFGWRSTLEMHLGSVGQTLLKRQLPEEAALVSKVLLHGGSELAVIYREPTHGVDVHLPIDPDVLSKALGITLGKLLDFNNHTTGYTITLPHYVEGVYPQKPGLNMSNRLRITLESCVRSDVGPVHNTLIDVSGSRYSLTTHSIRHLK